MDCGLCVGVSGLWTGGGLSGLWTENLSKYTSV